MATFLPPSLLLRTPNNAAVASASAHPTPRFRSTPQPRQTNLITIPKSVTLNLNPTTTRLHSTPPANNSDYESDVPESATNIVDEWGEKAEPERESELTRFTDADPAKDEDEWGGDDFGNGKIKEDVVETAAVVVEEVTDERIGDLKRALVDTVYGTNLGFGASVEVRAEVLELVNQLEAENPTPAPVEAPELLGGNWVLVYTAFSELLPLLALGTVPFLKVEKIRQDIDISSQTIVNSITVSSPFVSFSFSASASFEVRSPARIQVEFKEGTLKPPEITPKISLPTNLDIFGQRIDLSPLQPSINPVQDAVATISRAISGQPPLKLPIPGDRSQSWLITTFLDEDFRIGRGDGGLFVLAREGSSLLDQ
ncbi:hypothetical protein QQ045_019981 [Rhodiola kirilowii]